MHRATWLAALALILSPCSSPGQPPSGPAAAGRDGPPPAVAFREAGGFGGDVEGPMERTVRLEMEGGQKLEGTVYFRPLIVDSDLGQYTIRPEKIKMIQFLKRADVDDEAPPDEPRVPRANANAPVAARMMRVGPPHARVRGKVVTTTDKVIIGDIHIPTDFALELEFGRLSPSPEKLRILTMIDDNAPAAGPGAPADAPAPKADARQPGASPAGTPAKPGRPDQPGEPARSRRPGRGAR